MAADESGASGNQHRHDKDSLCRRLRSVVSSWASAVDSDPGRSGGTTRSSSASLPPAGRGFPASRCWASVISGRRRVGSSAGKGRCTTSGLRTGQLDDLLGQLGDRELARVSEIHRSDEIILRLHHADHALDQVVAVAERASLAAVAENGDVFTVQRLANEVRDHASVERMHSRSVRVEDAHDPDVDAIHPMVVHEQRLGGPFAFVVTGPRADRIDVSAVRFRLRMNLRDHRRLRWSTPAGPSRGIVWPSPTR